ncbi:hypothetical protein BJ965_007466 [Streptomyces luteogriseus]|uniref:Uncharacterized protein n=1 Tax=Streptomyces luteogriseus TaxID=68233 RepID=A0A7W7DWL8_9ACTN|nr:hypothetical protein [Streptomyces luteogriseus]
MTTTGLRARLQECTGFSSLPEERTALQQRNLDDILAVTKIPERTLESHLRFATFTFRDIVHNRLGGRNPFSDKGVVYSGSHDDAALNAGVERFSADPTAMRDLSYDSDITGRVAVPVLTLHAIDDPTAFVEHEAAYPAGLRGAKRDKHLVQTFTDEHEHSGLSTSEYANSISALDAWVRSGKKPTPVSIAASCPTFDASYGTGCFYKPAFTPAPYATRVNPRPDGLNWPAFSAHQEKKWSRQPSGASRPEPANGRRADPYTLRIPARRSRLPVSVLVSARFSVPASRSDRLAWRVGRIAEQAEVVQAARWTVHFAPWRSRCVRALPPPPPVSPWPQSRRWPSPPPPPALPRPRPRPTAEATPRGPAQPRT